MSQSVILLVEDDKLVSQIASGLLERGGFAVVPAHTSDEALRAASENAGSLRLLVTDVLMPGLKGPELACLIRQICPEILILYISGYTADMAAEEALLDPPGEFLEKSSLVYELVPLVRRLLDSRPTPAGSPEPVTPDS